ncbi:halotolerance protein [Xylariales sp. PMI_506]|nr:halotolerance protein [Xylariales sp. PMI_506]
MLQAISPEHDDHHVRSTRNSIAELTASLSDSRTHLLLAASGSVATIKLPLIVAALSAAHPPSELSIRVILTESASHFLAGQSPEQPTVSSLWDHPNVDGVYVDADEWKTPWKRGHSILHIELRRWADLLVIAPLSANTMAKIVHGFSDNLLTSVVRAWDTRGALDSDVNVAEPPSSEGGGGRRRGRVKKRIMVAPAMNTAMLMHPVTASQLRVLREDWGVGADGQGAGWFEVLPPQAKTLACGDVGDGAMMEWDQIVRAVEDRLGLINSSS